MRDFLTANGPSLQHAPSWYAATAPDDRSPVPLAEDLTADVCVVGGGFTGLSTALHLAEAGLDVVVLEANRIGWGASGRNGGQLGSGQRLSQPRLERIHGPEHARRLWEAAEEAKALVRDRIAQHAIDCDLRAGVLTAAHRRRFLPGLRNEVAHLEAAYGYREARCIDGDELREMLPARGYCGGVLDMGAGHLHPLRLAQGLARAAMDAGATLHEASCVSDYRATNRGVVARTGLAHVRAQHLVLACNGYLDQLDGDTASRILPINNYIVATEPLSPARAETVICGDFAVADTRFVVNYFRLSGDRRLLFGGGEGYATRFPADIAGFVRKRMLQLYPALADIGIDYAWGGTLAITRNRMPHFSRPAPNVYVAAGYSGHGVALAVWAGRAIAEAITTTAGRFDLLARTPAPRLPGGTRFGDTLLTLALLWHAIRDRL